MMRNLFSYFLFGIFLTNEAMAKEYSEEFCATAKAIQPKDEYCEDNDVFVRAAELCLKKLQRIVRKEGKDVEKLFSLKRENRQTMDFNHGSFDNRKASQRMAELIRLSKRVAARVDSYFDHVFFPIDSEMPEVNKGDSDGFVLSQPCYGKTVRSIDSILDDIANLGR